MMGPYLKMSVIQALEYQRDLAKNTKLPPAMIEGNLSHSPKWHAFSIIKHIQRVTSIAKKVIDSGELFEDLIIIAVWHDVGKFLSIQYGPDGPTFHGHAGVGAEFLEKSNSFPQHIIEAIRFHGFLNLSGAKTESWRKNYFLPWLELCDELGKWNRTEFPPKGSGRTRSRRAELLRTVVAHGVPASWVKFAEEVANDNELIDIALP